MPKPAKPGLPGTGDLCERHSQRLLNTRCSACCGHDRADKRRCALATGMCVHSRQNKCSVRVLERIYKKGAGA